jgi:adenosine/AMP kinase
MELKTVKIKKPEEINVVLGQTHFIKSVEDIYEALVTAIPGIEFGLAFCESSGKCLIRVEGSDEAMKKLAVANAERLACGHLFILFLKNAFPVNILPVLRNVPEICSIYCASANPIEVVVAETSQGRGVMGIIDGFPPRGVEEEEDINWRKNLLRDLGYKR